MSIKMVILAAGLGQRMQSAKPKVLHLLAGKPLLEHVIQTALMIAPNTKPIIIYGHQGAQLKSALSHYALQWIEQAKQLGTGHAVLQALPDIEDTDRVLILYGDVPLLSPELLQQFIQQTPPEAIGMITALVQHPTGYGRVLRDHQQQVIGIVEEKDASPLEKQIQEINSGIYIIPGQYLKKWLPQLKNNNGQQEYYLTDLISLAAAEHVPIVTLHPTQLEEILGVNDRVQLAKLERYYQRRCAETLMLQGVTMMDPNRFDVETLAQCQIAADVIIEPNVMLKGKIVIGKDTRIGANTVLKNVVIGEQVEIKENCVIEDAVIADQSIIGPFARLRPGTTLATQTHIGNFVEIKNSVIGKASKINHLSYIGDSDIGEQVNIGAGTITCNYDGKQKHKTIIGNHVFVGLDTQFIAPVRVGDGAVIGAGSTVTKDVPSESVTVTHHLEQRHLVKK